MSYATIQEAETKIAELEKEVHEVTRESMSRKTSIRDLTTRYEKLVDSLKDKGLDPTKDNFEEQWDAIVTSTKSEADKVKTESEKERLKSERRMKDLESQVNQFRQEREEAVKKQTEAEIKNALLNRMDKIIGAEDTIEAWVARGKVKKDGERLSFINEVGDEVSIDKHLEDFRKNNPERIKVEMKSGSGSSSSSPSGEGSQKKILKHSEYNKLTPEAQKELWDAGGDVIPD